MRLHWFRHMKRDEKVGVLRLEMETLGKLNDHIKLCEIDDEEHEQLMSMVRHLLRKKLIMMMKMSIERNRNVTTRIL